MAGVGAAALLTLPLTAAYQPPGAAQASGVSVVVISHNWADLRIYVVAEASQQRLGIVRSFNTEEFEVPKVILSARRRGHRELGQVSVRVDSGHARGDHRVAP